MNGPEVVQAVFGMAAANVATKSQQRKLKKIGNVMETFVEGLDNLLGPSPRKLRDAEYIRLTDYCKHNDTWKEYGKRPRTLALLRWLGCPEAIDGFVQDNLSDIALPYTERNLPRCVKGQEMRTRFLELQQYVLTNQAADLERAGGQHLNIERSAQKYFDVIKPLGSGGFGTVDHVVARLSLRQYALKRISRGQSFKRDKVAIRSFENELMSLKVLSHKHLVKLVGSYTDHDHIGLIMTPVADMNLEEYLSAPEQDCPDRKNCLRQFFGCLAAGVEYLHSQKIRHKDIKPKNVLVLMNYRRVLLTDFGTAHNWSDDPGGSSSGTVHEAFTERYCAPEVFGRKRRNESSDIWSLGCIFLEMSTVLSDLTVRQMQEFFNVTGNGRHFIRENPAACEAWCKKISNQFSLPFDAQVLDLGTRLCHMIPLERPTAAEIASEIVDFRGPVKYHCGCCDLKSDHWTNMDMVTDMQNITRTEEWPMADPVTPGPDQGDIFEESSPINEVLSDDTEPQVLIEAAPTASNELLPQVDPPKPLVDESATTYKPPSAQEIQEDVTVLYYDSEEFPICGPRGDEENSRNGFTGHDIMTLSTDTIIDWNTSKANLSRSRPHDRESSQELRCDWPQCKEVFTTTEDTTSEQLLLAHCRSGHGCHDFGRSMALLRRTSFPSEDLSKGLPLPLEPAQLVNYLIDSDCEDTDHIVQRIRAAKIDRREKRRTAVAVPGGKSVPSTPAVVYSGSPSPDLSSTSTEAPSAITPQASRSDRVLRFNALPEDRRPEVTAVPFEPRYREREFDPEDVLEEPLLDVFWPSLSASRHGGPSSADTGATLGLPVASFVPSFHLAAANRFSRQEVSRLDTPFTNALFVYGTLMLPAVLKACAEHYISEEGIYSSQYQRRLRTSPTDWGYINESLQSAAEKMTPGILRGFDRGAVRRRPWAFLSVSLPYHDARYVEEEREVHGFVISGLSAEALCCLEHWHNEEMPSRLGFLAKPTSSAKEDRQWKKRLFFSRDEATASIQQTDGKAKTIKAVVFHCLDHRYGPQRDEAFACPDLPFWDINDFLRSAFFPSLCAGSKNLNREEKRLADTMKIRFVMRGDVLCSAVLKGDKEKAMLYIDKGYDVNAKCTTYGTALQAAAAKGKEEMVTLLLVEGADVNSSGGRYNSALIAAVVHGHEDLARDLLASKANVLAHGGQYVNALYQAVSFSDISMAHLLLEKGAWLSENYLEILDVAAENGNRHMSRMLEDYDVRGLWKRRLIDQQQQSSESGSDVNDNLTYVPYDERRAMEKPRSLPLVRAVMLEAFALKGQRGKWTGIKAVRLLQTAIRMGASERIIDRAAPFLSSYERLVAVICEAAKQHEEEKKQLEESDRRSSPREIETSSTGSPTFGLGQDVVNSMPVSSYPTPSSSPPSTSSPPPRARAPASPSDPDADVLCLTCGGRGGRAGTERTCNECSGSKMIWRRQGTHSQRLPCPTCAGRGYTFSSRDICRACRSTNSSATPTFARTGSRARFGGADARHAPPPPYSP